MEIAIELSGIFLGVLARTLAPYLRKLREGKIKKFRKGYLLSSLAGFILATIITLLIFPKFEVVTEGVGIEANIKLFSLAFGFGFGWNAIVAECAKWSGAFKE